MGWIYSALDIFLSVLIAITIVWKVNLIEKIEEGEVLNFNKILSHMDLCQDTTFALMLPFLDMNHIFICLDTLFLNIVFNREIQ